MNYLPGCAFALSLIVLNGTVRIVATSVIGAAAAREGQLATLTFESEGVSGNVALQTEGSDDVGWLGKVEGNKATLKLVRGKEIGNEMTYVIKGKVSDAAGNSTDVSVTFVTKGKERQFEKDSWRFQGRRIRRDIDFAAEEQAIRDLYAEYALAHGDQDVDALTDVWLPSESKDIFTAWTFWAGTFEKNEGAKAVNKAWDGIFRLHGGKMEVDITYIAIDSRGKEAVLRGAYTWGNQKGDLISGLKKDDNDWKIRAIDYTDGRFGKQVKYLIEPAHTFGEILENSDVVVTGRPPIDFAAEKAAIQAVYSAFYTAFNDNDMKAIAETFRTNDGKVAFGTIFAGNEPVPIAFGWRNVEIAIEGLWIGIGTKGAKWGRDDVLKDFWIRYKGSKIEASAIGYNCYKGSFPGETHLYLMKEEKDGWKIHELDSSTENNLGIFGFHKGKPRLKEAGRFFTTSADKVPE